MISEFVYLPASGKPQWIELFNANAHYLPIDLSDFRVQRTSNGVFETVYTIPTNTLIEAGDTLLIVGPGSGVTGDLTGSIDLEKPYDGTNSHAEGFDAYGYEIFAPFTFTSNSLVRKWPAEDRNVGGLEWMWTNNPTPHRAGQGVDADQDGLTTLQEWTGSQNPFSQEPTDPFDADSDDDGLSDLLEMTNSPPTNPLSPDTDGDDFPWGTTRYTQDNQEAGVGTDPHNPDTDGDGLYDGWELALGLDPLDTDSDNDGTPDGDEDYDGDGVSNVAELAANSNPANAAQTTGGPYIVMHQHTKPNWSNGDDFGYGGVLTVTFSNLRPNQNVCVLLEEGGYEVENFKPIWQGAAQQSWTPARTGITSATVGNGQNTMRLVVTDRSPPPHLQPANQGADVKYTPITESTPGWTTVDTRFLGFGGPAHPYLDFVDPTNPGLNDPPWNVPQCIVVCAMESVLGIRDLDNQGVAWSINTNVEFFRFKSFNVYGVRFSVYRADSLPTGYYASPITKNTTLKDVHCACTN